MQNMSSMHEEWKIAAHENAAISITSFTTGHDVTLGSWNKLALDIMIHFRGGGIETKSAYSRS